jgi:teichuronic acid biosynthesis glycosyltransferase TuaC
MVSKKQEGSSMKVLAITNMYPSPEEPDLGPFIKAQIDSQIKEGIDMDVLFINGKKNKLNYLWGFFRLWARLLTRRYDLIHAHYVFMGILARFQIFYPIVLTHTGAQVFHGWQAPLSRIISRMVDRVIVRTQEMKDRMGVEDVEIIPAGVNFDLFKPMPREECRRQLGLPVGKKLVLWAGAYRNPRKRYDIVEKAMAVLKGKMPEAELVLATGHPLDVIPLYMNACDVLLLVSNAEGSPNVIKESMACNLPVVSVPVGDVPQVIGGTEGCYLCTQDPEDVADKLQIALQWGKRTNGRKNIQHLEVGVISRRLISLYEGLLQEKQGRGIARFRFWGNNSKGKYQRHYEESMSGQTEVLSDAKKPASERRDSC